MIEGQPGEVWFRLLNGNTRLPITGVASQLTGQIGIPGVGLKNSTNAVREATPISPVPNGEGWYIIDAVASEVALYSIVATCSTAVANAIVIPYSFPVYPPGYTPVAGLGTIPVNQNTGGTGNLRLVNDFGVGVGGVSIFVYGLADWPNNTKNIVDQSLTDQNGNWVRPCYVPHGTFVAVFSAPSIYPTSASNPFTV